MFKFLLLISLVSSHVASAKHLVSQETIDFQKKATTVTKLNNGIPVVFREVTGSDILEVVVTFDYGVRDLPVGRKSYASLLFSTMAMAAKDYPKSKVFSMTEKYALELGCSSGIEMSSCAIGTLNEHWSSVHDLFAAIVNTPALTDTDLKLQASRTSASFKSNIQSSDRYVNDVVNQVFYEKNHPYRQLAKDSLTELTQFKRQDMTKLHKDALNAKRMAIIVVGSYDQMKMLKGLNSMFGKIKSRAYSRPKVPEPRFDPEKSFSFENRDIPTAYIRAKFNALGQNHKDSVAQSLMIKVLDEELGEEIRTKRSLSYSVWSYAIQYEIGIGMLSASTSKPEETLEAMRAVLEKIRDKPLTADKLDEYKTVYATKYFLTLETHSSLASALANTYHYKKSLDDLYEMPRRLDKVTAKDVQRLAKQLLRDLRVGIVYNQDKFKDQWVNTFISASHTAKKES